MHQHLRDSMRFLYKQESVSYEDLLVATREAEAEWTENKSIPVRVRSTTLNEEVGLKDLKKEVEPLTTALKAFQGAKPKKGNAPPPRISKLRRAKPQIRHQISKSKGPQLSAAGPFSPTDKPMQCFKCGGWGHGWRNCPSQGNINWRELYRASLSPTVEGPEKTDQ